MNKYYILYVAFIAMVFSSSIATGQSISVSFDSTIVDAPMHVYGEISNVNTIKGVHIVLRDTTTKSDLFNDTLFFISNDNGGSAKVICDGKKTIFKGDKFYRYFALKNDKRGLVSFQTMILYKNGQIGEKKTSYVTK